MLLRSIPFLNSTKDATHAKTFIIRRFLVMVGMLRIIYSQLVVKTSAKLLKISVIPHKIKAIPTFFQFFAYFFLVFV